MMVVGFFGCCGAIQESPCMLGLVIPTSWTFSSWISLSTIMRWLTLVFECFFPVVLLLSFGHICGRGGCWNLGLFQPDQGGSFKFSVHAYPYTQTVLLIYVNIFVPIGYWRYNAFLQGNVQKLPRHQTGHSERHTHSHPAWSKISSLSPYFSKIFSIIAAVHLKLLNIFQYHEPCEHQLLVGSYCL